MWKYLALESRVDRKKERWLLKLDESLDRVKSPRGKAGKRVSL